jgi:sulfur carrier protein
MRPDASFIQANRSPVAAAIEGLGGLLHIQVNGEPREVPLEVSLHELLTHLEVPADRVAIELNQRVVRRVEWTEVKLREADRVEIVHFVGGGATFSRVGCSRSL